MSDVAVSARIVGRVQGVSFRWACQREAERLGVRGWVGNEPDESVAAHFEGARDAVDQLVAWCRSARRRLRSPAWTCTAPTRRV